MIADGCVFNNEASRFATLVLSWSILRRNLAFSVLRLVTNSDNFTKSFFRSLSLEVKVFESVLVVDKDSLRTFIKSSHKIAVWWCCNWMSSRWIGLGEISSIRALSNCGIIYCILVLFISTHCGESDYNISRRLSLGIKWTQLMRQQRCPLERNKCNLRDSKVSWR